MRSKDEYPAREIEEKWQKWWNDKGLYLTKHPPRQKYYVLEMFPYPSGDLHMGHLKNYVIGDVVARVKIMEGYDILHPMGWDSFGLPAENAAIKKGVDPKKWTENNINTYRNTLKKLGISYDWTREIATSDPDYYRWTQWIFLFLYKKGLAYRKKDYVNWCPNCKTVLANEQVIDGKCERCKTPVVKKELEQWFFKITDYAERLLEDLKELEGKWPPQVLKLQENWIGRSEGCEIVFELEGKGIKLPVFTTRADTLFGVTFMTIAPEHYLLPEIIEDSPHREEVEEYVRQALLKSEAERTKEEREKTGVFTGKYAIHPFTGEKIPIWVGDYVLANYGTGIVMGVPAHDQRDFEFAKKYGLPIRVVIKPEDGDEPRPEEMEAAFEDYGVMINSGEFTGLPSREGIERVASRLREMGKGGKTVSYRLKDWLISRQRYWGAPIPMIHCEKCGYVPVPEDQLPVRLPEGIRDFRPKGRSPLADVPEFIETKCPVCGGPARRDPDTMDTFVDSSWYHLRYIDPRNEEMPFDPEKAEAWMPVDQYIGGAEHATKHLIYARFIHKVLYDAGLLKTKEPYLHLFTQGLVLKRFFWCNHCLRVVEENEIEKGIHKACGNPIEERLEMMSKSKGNIVPVGPFVEKHGADTARITILFAGPAEKDMEWTDAGVEGARRFLNRIWRLYSKHRDKLRGEIPDFDPEKLSKEEKDLYIALQKTIFEVRKDSSEFHFNTALARLMELLTAMSRFEKTDSPVFLRSLREYIVLLAPFAPHLSEELWHWTGAESSVFSNRFPEYDPRYTRGELTEIAVQINGKVRARLQVQRGLEEKQVLDLALKEENVRRHLQGKNIRKTIYVKDKLLNIVAG